LPLLKFQPSYVNVQSCMYSVFSRFHSSIRFQGQDVGMIVHMRNRHLAFF